MNTQQQQEQQLAQMQAMVDDLVHWIVSVDHTRPGSIVQVPEGTGNMTIEQAKRMSDEYEIVGGLISILDHTKQQLVSYGVRPMTYGEQIAARFNALMNPSVGQIISHLHTMYSNAAVTSAADYLQILVEMFARIDTLRNAYSHVLYAPQTNQR